MKRVGTTNTIVKGENLAATAKFGREIETGTNGGDKERRVEQEEGKEETTD